MDLDFHSLFETACGVSAFVVLVLGLCLTFVQVPPGPALHSYRVSRRLLGLSYGIFGVLGFLGFFVQANEVLTLVNASFQTLFVPLALVVLVNADFLDQRRLWWPLVPVTGLSALALGSLFIPGLHWLSAGVFWIFLGFYGVLYTWTTWRSLRQILWAWTRAKASDSRQSFGFVRWVLTMTVLSNLCGVLALALALGLFPSWIFAFLVISAIGTAYLVLALKYLNYPHTFRLVAAVVHPGAAVSGARPSALEGVDVDRVVAYLTELMATEKPHRSQNLTVDQLGRLVGLKPRQLSELLNSRLGRNFRSYVNLHRVNDARKLLGTASDRSVLDIALECGFASKSNFNQVFKIETGMTPREWRQGSRAPVSG